MEWVDVLQWQLAGRSGSPTHFYKPSLIDAERSMSFHRGYQGQERRECLDGRSPRKAQVRTFTNPDAGRFEEPDLAC